MTEPPFLFFGGLLCGLLAGGGAQFGRFCSFTAIEDAVLAGDYRRARVFGLALATAILATQLLSGFHIVDLGQNPYAQPQIDLAGVVVGATLFGLGMALVGTCGFGLILRAGTGDIRALLSATVLGIAAAAATGGLLAPLRQWISGLLVVDRQSLGWANIQGLLPSTGVVTAEGVATALIAGALLTAIFSSYRFRCRPNLMIGGLLLGISVALGWLVTSRLIDQFSSHPTESLTFVAPLARLIHVIMGDTFTQSAFSIGTVLGVAAGSFLVAAYREDLRWEAFDDQREMRRHLLGAGLMGFGGILAKGCTIGQGLSASSVLAISAPIAIMFMILGARIGLYYLVEAGGVLGSWGRAND